VERLRRAPEIAVDTEGDSLHHYPARLALLQIAEPDGTVSFVDPIAIENLAALGPVFADPAVTLVFHAGDNDLIELKRRYRFTFGRVFDTSIAARFLGVRALGLDALLGQWLGVELPPSRQKDDWSARPLKPAQEDYAAADVQHLFTLKARLIDELDRIGRRAWVEEECAALAAVEVPDRGVDPEAFLRVKGARDLPPRTLGVLRELYETREALARTADRPPFKVLGEDTLLRLAQMLPATPAELAQVPGCTPRVVGRWGGALLEAIARGRALPDDALPVMRRSPRPPGNPAAARRAEVLRKWRVDAAERHALDPGVLLPNRLIGAIAEAGPTDVASLAAVDGVRRWRAENFGAEVVAALGSVERRAR
jgi:ribonuclease D